jgi:NADH:ubiquinone oxidoreductase subunit 6 (subunit J)
MFFVSFLNIIIHFILIVFLIHFLGYYGSFFILTNLFYIFFNIVLPLSIISSLLFSLLIVNPVSALLSILFSFLCLSFFLFNINSEIITFTFLIVYMGAVMMLFLFVIMLFNLQNLQIQFNKFLNNYYISLPFFFFLFLYFLNFIENLLIVNLNLKNSPWIFFQTLDFSTLFFFSHITTNGNLIFKTFYSLEHNFFFLFLTLLLLFAMIAAINTALLTRKVLK